MTRNDRREGLGPEGNGEPGAVSQKGDMAASRRKKKQGVVTVSTKNRGQKTR